MCHLTCRFLFAAIVTGSAVIAVPAWGQLINEDQKLLASDGDPDDFFGGDLAVDNGILVVGATSDRDNGIQSGAAYLFDTSTGTQLSKLLPQDGRAHAFFGNAVAIENDVVVVGANLDSEVASDAGAVYLFSAKTGNQQLKLTPSDAAASDRFGTSVAIDSAVVAVGSRSDGGNGFFSGSVYLFDANTGQQIRKLIAPDGHSLDHFRSSVSIQSFIIAVGAKGDDDEANRSGSIYLFNALTGEMLRKITRPIPAPDEELGANLSIDEDYVVSTIYREQDPGYLGSVCVFSLDSGEQLREIVPSNTADEQFDLCVDISSGRIAIGIRRDNGPVTHTGLAHLYLAENGQLLHTLEPSDGAEDDWFGHSIAIDNDMITVGAVLDDDNGANSGSAYVFTLPDTDCPADFTGEGSLDIFDILAFLDAFNNAEPAADFTSDSNFDIFDILAFLDAFNAGCP